MYMYNTAIFCPVENLFSLSNYFLKKAQFDTTYLFSFWLFKRLFSKDYFQKTLFWRVLHCTHIFWNFQTDQCMWFLKGKWYINNIALFAFCFKLNMYWMSIERWRVQLVKTFTQHYLRWRVFDWRQCICTQNPFFF